MKKILKASIAFNKIGFALCLVFSLVLYASFSWAEVITVHCGESIQTAINNAESGDTVYVLPSDVEPYTCIYDEDITMEAGVDLLGADKKTTIIQGYIVGKSETTLDNFTVTDDGSVSAKLYECLSGDNVNIKNCAFKVDTNRYDYYGIHLYDVTSGEIANNSVNIDSTNSKVTGINISGSGVVCTNNNLYIKGVDEVEGLNYSGTAHIVKNNIIKTDASGSAAAVIGNDELDIDYNLLFGSIGGNVDLLIGNLLGVDPIFDPAVFDPGNSLLPILATSPAKCAADPTNSLYAMGLTDIGTYDSSVVLKDIREIQARINKAQPGDTVFLRPGTYTILGNWGRGWPSFTQCNGKRAIYSHDLLINKNITLKAVDPDPDHTVIDFEELNRTYPHFSHSISIMDGRYYYGDRYYGYGGFNTVNDVTIEGITIRGRCYGSETIRIWIPIVVNTGLNTGYGYVQQTSGYWAYFSTSRVKAPIYNFSEKLTLRNCKILSETSGVSIYTFLRTTVDEDGYTCDNRAGGLITESNSYASSFRCPY